METKKTGIHEVRLVCLVVGTFVRCMLKNWNTTIHLLTVASFMCKTGYVKQETDDNNRTKRYVVSLKDERVLLTYCSQDLFLNQIYTQA